MAALGEKKDMPRKKTYLSKDEQCLKTIQLANEWIQEINPYIKMLPKFLSENYDAKSWDRACEAIDKSAKPRFKSSMKSLMGSFWGDDAFEIGNWKVGVANKNTKHMIKNDIVLVLMHNGTDRLPIFTVSAKGRRLAGYFSETDRLGLSRTIRLFEFPDELIDEELSHPDAQAFMLKLRADMCPPSGRRV